MKKFLLTALSLIICAFVAFSPLSAFADVETSSADYLEEFLAACPSRVTGSSGCADAANFLANSFSSIGLNVEKQSFQFSDDYSSTTAQNVVATLVAPNRTTEKYVVVGAHYDAVSEGASDNASGVVAVFSLAEKLVAVKNSLACNVVFVMFAGEEQGFYGSKYFVSSLNSVGDVLLMINVDSIAAGDNLYLYCEDVQTDFQKFISDNADESRCSLLAKPLGADLSYSFIYFYGYGYGQTAQNSDQTSFRLNGVPCALFFSGNYTVKDLGYVESAVEENRVMNSSGDTLNHLKSLGSQYVDRMETVTNTIYNTLTAQNFVGVMSAARGELVNLDVAYGYLWQILASAVLLIAAIIFAVVYFRKLTKNAILEAPEVKTERVFKAPDVEDIFKFKD